MFEIESNHWSILMSNIKGMPKVRHFLSKQGNRVFLVALQIILARYKVFKFLFSAKFDFLQWYQNYTIFFTAAEQKEFPDFLPSLHHFLKIVLNFTEFNWVYFDKQPLSQVFHNFRSSCKACNINSTRLVPPMLDNNNS